MNETSPSRPWHAVGLGAGLLTALLLAFVEWIILRTAPDAHSIGFGDHVKFLATTFTVFGFVTVPLGLGLGLCIAGFDGWLNLGESWRRLREDDDYRARHESTVTAIVVSVPLMMAVVAAIAFVVQRTFVRHMNNPTMSSAFMALSVLVALLLGVAMLGVCVVIFRSLLPRLGLANFARREPRLLRAVLWLLGLDVLAVLILAFVWLYNPEVWPAIWVIFLFATAFGPLLLILSGRLMAWTKIFRAPVATASALLFFMALSGWTYLGLGAWDDVRGEVLEDTVFTPTLAGLIHRVTDMDGDRQSAILGGGDCDDSNPAVYSGAQEIPGNGLDDNCLGGDAPASVDNADPQSTSPDVLGNEGTGAPIAEEGVAEGIPEEPDEPIDQRKNIVFLLIDTLRPDHLGYFGYERDISPSIDALARESVVFTRTYAQGARTPSSIPSIFTSRFASHLDLENPTHNYPDLRESNLTLFEALQEIGYFTMAVTSHYYFDRSPGMQQGFDVFDNRGSLSISETNTASSAPEIFAKLEEQVSTLVESEEPFLLFVHYYEPHSRWMPHPEVVDFGRVPRGRQRHINNYDSEIAFVDQYVQRTVDLLRDNGLYDDSIIVLIADHGEAFREHGHYFHGQTLYDEIIRVPLFLRVPGLEHAEVDTPVALLDVAPTLFDLIGAPIPAEFEGRSLMRTYPDVPSADVFSELLPYSNFDEHLVTLIRGNLKLIYLVSGRRYEMYDLDADPGEQENIFRESSDADALQERLIQWMEGG